MQLGTVYASILLHINLIQPSTNKPIIMDLKSLIDFLLKESWILLKLALPVYLTTLTSEINNSFIPSIFSGHYGDRNDNYAAIALSTNIIMITGTLPHLCISSSLNTLASQAFGARRHKYLGILYQRSILIHLLICLPIAILWINTQNILILLGQSAELAKLSGDYMLIYLAILPSYAILYPSMKIMQIQDIVLPSALIFFFGSLLEVGACYLFLYQTDLGIKGIALGVVVSVYFMTVTHFIYLRSMSIWSRFWNGSSWESLEKWGQYFYFGVPVLVISTIEFLIFYIGAFVIGATSINSGFSISKYALVINIDLILYLFSVAANSATSIRIGYLVGRREVKKVKKIALLTTVLVLIFQLLQVSILLAGKSTWGYIFTSDVKVVEGVIGIYYILAIYHPIDGILYNFQGILVGIGKQNLGIIFPIIFGIITVPTGTLLTITAGLGALGYWLGLLIGMVVRFILAIPIVLCLINWDRISEVDKINQSEDNTVRPVSNEDIRLLSQSKEIPKPPELKVKVARKKFYFIICKLCTIIILTTILIITTICHYIGYKMEIIIGPSYMKMPIDFCCLRLKLYTNNTSIATN